MRRLGLLLVLTVPSCSDDGLAPAQSTGTSGAANTGLGTTLDDSNEGADLGSGGDGTTFGSTFGSTSDSPPAPTGTTSMGGETVGDPTDSTSAGESSSSGDDGSSSSSDGGSSSSSDGGSSSSGGMMLSCPGIGGTSLIGGPADLYGFCWYLTAPMDTCDSACAELVGGANLAPMAESAYADHCNAPAGEDISTWFFNNGNPGGWTMAGSTTSGHTLGYGYSMAGTYYGKCSSGGTEIGTYPGEMVGGGLESERQLVCACALGTP